MAESTTTIPWKPVGFNGLRLDIPPTWDLVEIGEENVGDYMFRFDEEGELRLLVRTLRRRVRQFNPAKPTGKALASIGKNLPATHRKDFHPEAIQSVRVGRPGSEFDAVLVEWKALELAGHILTFRDPERETTYMFAFQWNAKNTRESNNAILTAIGKSMALGPESSGNIRWRFGGLSFALEPDWRIEHIGVTAGKTILSFRHQLRKGEQLHIGRWGMANLLLKSLTFDLWPLRIFGRRQYFFRIDTTPEDRTRSHPDREVLIMTGRPYGVFQLLLAAARRVVKPSDGARLDGRLLHDKKENAIIMAASQGRLGAETIDCEPLLAGIDLDVVHPRPSLPKRRDVVLNSDRSGKPIITPSVQLASIPTKNRVVELKKEGETVWYLEAPAQMNWKIKTLRYMSGQHRDEAQPLRLVLDDAGLFIWNRIDGQTRFDRIILDFSTEFRLGHYEAQVAIWEFMKTLVQRNLCGIVVPSRDA
ncbi:MAG: PqqD family protein [Planctomycetota bacterium]